MQLQRHLSLIAFHEFQPPVVALPQPVQKLDGIADRGRQKQRADVLGQQPQRQFPDDPAFDVGEAMELVHHDRGDVAEVEGRRGVGSGKGDSPHLCEAPFGPFRQMGTVPFSAPSAVQEAVQQDFGHHHQYPGIGVLAAVAGHEADIIRLKTPFHRRRLHFAELLFRKAISGVV